jgi:hypothetical protein
MKNKQCSVKSKTRNSNSPIEQFYVNKKPIDEVTIDRLDFVLRFLNIILQKDKLDIIIDAVELIEDKGGEVTIDDLCDLREIHRKLAEQNGN